MKMIVAFVKPHRFAAVSLALHEVEGLGGASAGDVRSFRRGRAKSAPDRRQQDLVDFVPSVRIEVACDDGLTEQVVETIERAAHTGLRGDGRIYELTIEEAVRISTGERGTSAI